MWIKIDVLSTNTLSIIFKINDLQELITYIDNRYFCIIRGNTHRISLETYEHLESIVISAPIEVEQQADIRKIRA
jgi:hypothetical protein